MQSSVIHYFAYGSNLHPLRLKERIPSATLVGAVDCCGQELRFHKKSTDGSGKCNLIKTEDNTAIAYGAIYQLKPEDKSILDRFEGKGFGYTDQQILLQHDSREYACFTYVAQFSHIIENLQPYHWYKELVTLGAAYLDLPNSYRNAIKDTNSLPDPDSARSRLNESLIERMTRYRN